jgi:hypothetical protein
MNQTEHILPSKHVLKDKFNRVIKTFEDFRIGRRTQSDGTVLTLQGGKTIAVEQPRSKFEKPESEKHSPMSSGNKGRPATLKL